MIVTKIQTVYCIAERLSASRDQANAPLNFHAFRSRKREDR